MAKSVYTNEDIDKLEADEAINGNTTKRTTWYSIPSELLNDINYCQKMKEISPHYFTFHCYLKTQMLANEKYYVFEKNISTVLMLYSALFGVDIKEVRKIYNDLMDCGYIRTVNPNCFNKQSIIIDDTVVDNYYQAQKKRALERVKAQNKAAHKSANAIPPIKSGIQPAFVNEETTSDEINTSEIDPSPKSTENKVVKATDIEVPTCPLTAIEDDFSICDEESDSTEHSFW